jgi:hypothetical protein
MNCCTVLYFRYILFYPTNSLYLSLSPFPLRKLEPSSASRYEVCETNFLPMTRVEVLILSMALGRVSLGNPRRRSGVSSDMHVWRPGVFSFFLAKHTYMSRL